MSSLAQHTQRSDVEAQRTANEVGRTLARRMQRAMPSRLLDQVSVTLKLLVHSPLDSGHRELPAHAADPGPNCIEQILWRNLQCAADHTGWNSLRPDFGVMMRRPWRAIAHRGMPLLNRGFTAPRFAR